MNNKTLTIGKTKNKTTLVLPLVGEALDIIKDLYSQNARTAYLFPGKEKGGWNSYETAFEHAVKRANIPNFTFHCLRHTTASYLVQQGVPLYTIGRILNHKSLEMTARYAHLATNNLKGALEILAHRPE